MAIADTDLAKVYSGQSTLLILGGTLWYQLGAKNYEADLQTRKTVIIENPSTYGSSPTAYTRRSNYKSTPTEATGAQIEMTMETQDEDFIRIDHLDALETPLDYLGRSQTESAGKMAIEVDKDFATEFVLSGNFTSARNNQPTFGTAGSQFISRSSPYAGTGRGYGLMMDALDGFKIYAARQIKLLRANRVLVGGSAGSAFCVAPVELIQGFGTWLAEKGYSWDELTSSILSDNEILSGGEYAGTLKNVEFFSEAESLTVPTGTGNWNVYFGYQAAVEVAVRPTFTSLIDPRANQTGPFYDYHAISYGGKKVVNPTLLYRATIHAD